MRLRVRFRRLWRHREVVAIMLRGRANGRLVEHYAAQVTLPASGRISFATIEVLVLRARKKLAALGVDRGSAAYMIRSLGSYVVTHAWVREYRQGAATGAFADYATVGLRRVETVLRGTHET